MIKYLILNNLILVDSCEIQFGPSFNAVTGETGAGKTALIEAIGLAIGERAETSLIRKGCDKAYVEIAFEIHSLPDLLQLLEESGLRIEEELIIRREIVKEGKNRTFVNGYMTPLPLLQKIGSALIDKVSQHLHQSLRSSDSQRNLLDLFGSLQNEVKYFQAAYGKARQLQEELDIREQKRLQKEREEDLLRYQLKEIEATALKKGEEESVFENYQKLTHAQELSEKSHAMELGVSSLLSQISSFLKTCDSLAAYEKQFNEIASLFRESHIAMTEALRFFQSYSEQFCSEPHSLQSLEERLSAITRLKRKYGQTFEEVEAYRQKLLSELSEWENLVEEGEKLKGELRLVQEDVDKRANELSIKRKETALRFQKELSLQLQELNMSGSELTIEITPQDRGISGDDAIHFWLKANTGEHPCLVKERSSGGELSRLLFAVKIALAEKNNTPTLIFDEIDANVGGKTAAIMAEKLKILGKCRQIICISHFPQVVSKADEHFSVEKIESQGRTFTQIKQLSHKERKQELLRMLGESALPI